MKKKTAPHTFSIFRWYFFIGLWEINFPTTSRLTLHLSISQPLSLLFSLLSLCFIFLQFPSCTLNLFTLISIVYLSRIRNGPQPSHHLHHVVDSAGNFDSKAFVPKDSAVDAYSELRIRISRCESEINHTLATISSPLRNRIPLRRRHLQVKHLSLFSPSVLFVIVIGWFCSSLNNL